MTTHPSATTLAQTIAAIRPRRQVKLRAHIFSADGDQVRVQLEGQPDVTFDGRSALIAGETILKHAHPELASDRPVIEGARAHIAVAKSIPAAE